MDNSEKIEKLEWCVRAVLKAYDHNSGEPFAISEYWIEQAEAALALPNTKFSRAADGAGSETTTPPALAETPCSAVSEGGQR